MFLHSKVFGRFLYWTWSNESFVARTLVEPTSKSRREMTSRQGIMPCWPRHHKARTQRERANKKREFYEYFYRKTKVLDYWLWVCNFEFDCAIRRIKVIYVVKWQLQWPILANRDSGWFWVGFLVFSIFDSIDYKNRLFYYTSGHFWPKMSIEDNNTT